MSLLLIQQKIKLTGQINIGRSSHPEVFCEKDVLRNSSKFRTPLVLLYWTILTEMLLKSEVFIYIWGLCKSRHDSLRKFLLEAWNDRSKSQY